MWSTPLAGRIELAEQLVNRANGEASALRAIHDYVGVDMLVSESVAAAIGIVLLARGDPMKAVRFSANVGGDTDTIGAIAGQVCGAWQGLEAVDERMMKQVEEVNHLNLQEESRRIEDMLPGQPGVVPG
jgi:ADP-ribosylglycohydrolase